MIIEWLRRTYYWIEPQLDFSADGKLRFQRKMTRLVKDGILPVQRVPYDSCNLVGSRCQNGPAATDADDELHLPLFDVDPTAQLSLMRIFPRGMWIPSYTPQHYHLFLEEALPWASAAVLVRYLLARGYLDREWAQASLDQGQMFLRKPVNSSYRP